MGKKSKDVLFVSEIEDSEETKNREIERMKSWHGEQAVKIAEGIIKYLKSQNCTYGESVKACGAARELLKIQVSANSKQKALQSLLDETKI